MLKRLLITVIFTLMVPTFAHAYNYWSIAAGTSPVIAGAITPPPNSSEYNTVGSTTYITSSTVTTADFTVAAAPPGYTLSYVSIDGVRSNPVAPNTYRVSKGTKINHTISAVYAAQTYTITTSKTGNGYIDPTVTVAGGSSKTITMYPGTGYRIADVTVNGMSVGAVSSYTFTNIQSNQTISVTFDVIPVVNAVITTSPQNVVVGSPITIDATASTASVPPTYTWTVTPASATLIPAADGKTAQFSANAIGTYTVNLALSAPGATSSYASVDITVITQSAFGAQACISCHNDRNPQIVTKYTTSKHYSTTSMEVSCATCHNPGGALLHPYIVRPIDSCQGCHVGPSGTVPNHAADIGTNTCGNCHDPHAAVGMYAQTGVHYNNITSAMYPASYVTSRAVCANCHYDSSATNPTIRHEWAQSGHAATNSLAWRAYDFKTMSGCVQCHTTTGFIAYSSGRVTTAWGDAADKTKELLTCIGCHNDITTGALRTVTPVSPYADDSYTNPDTGKSNICMDCHSGTRNGKSITARLEALADFTNLPFIDPHYMAASGTLYGKAGYHFPGRTYSSEATHRGLGSLDASGPCISCHKNSANGHTFQTGVIPLCASCHGASLDAAMLTADKADFVNALEVLRAQLAANGFVATGTPPSFGNTNWGSGQAGADTMGAAFNYVLLASEPGGYAHDPAYAKQLALDSIDYLDNSQLDDSVNNLAVPNLLASGAISQAVADSLTAYKAKNSCTVCHGGTSSSAAPMATNGHGTHLSRDYGPGLYLGSDLGSCQTCHVYGSATHMNGSVDLTGACTGCHPSAVPAWTVTSRLGCASCHAPVPSVLPNGVAAPYKADFYTTGHGQFTASIQCTDCHDPDSRHITGSLGDSLRLGLPNDNNLCASCHNDLAKVGFAFYNMLTHVSLDCRICHNPHGTSNLSMIRTAVNGTAITFTDRTNGLVDPASNLGLCQVCHTTTAHYRAGVPETSHYTSGCLNCHTHNAVGGAFKPAGGSCDACHGYPPAPKNPSVPFGTANNWSNARFEDYSGGGGAHLVAAHVSPNAQPSEGWANCTICHNNGATDTPYHQMVTPVKDHIDNVTIAVDPRYRFAPGFTIYTGAKLVNPPAQNVTGSCYNISCHMSPSPRWSTER